MKASDYIVDYFLNRGIDEFFGYQGTMVAHLVDSIEANPKSKNHSCYNEQGAAFAACGYTKTTGTPSLAYATSGPGAVNLLSGIADAYCDSLPIVFLCGQINTYEYAGITGLRQQGFQEIDIVSMAKPVTKLALQVQSAEEIPAALQTAYEAATSGRPGPVLIDIPMNVQRGEIDDDLIKRYQETTPVLEAGNTSAAGVIAQKLAEAKNPIILVGMGVRNEFSRPLVMDIATKYEIPIVTGLLSIDFLPTEHDLNMGYIGYAYGHRYANLITNTKADLIVCLGVSLCPRQVGNVIDRFAPTATIVRVDIDPEALKRRVHSDETEIGFVGDAGAVLTELRDILDESDLQPFSDWAETCREIRSALRVFDDSQEDRLPNEVVAHLGRTVLRDCATIAVDVGQHMLWAAQSHEVQTGQKLLFSGGHGAMGFALPAAIGAAYTTDSRIGCVAGDGCMQMNIQELQWVARENLPITIIVLNNQSLGLIRQQQFDYFDSVYSGSTGDYGFVSPNFAEIAKAYGIPAIQVSGEQAAELDLSDSIPADGPILIEVCLDEATFALPKTALGEVMHNQKPYMPPELLDELTSL